MSRRPHDARTARGPRLDGRTRLAAATAFGLVVGCARPAVPEDAADGSDLDADAFVVDDIPARDTRSCDSGIAPADVPTVTAAFVVLDGDGSSGRPTAAGGEPRGRWVASAITLYYPSTLAGRVDLARSTVRGTGWAEFDGSQYAFAMNLDTSFATSIVGRVNDMWHARSTGAYTAMNERLRLVPSCASGRPLGMTVGFSLDAPDRSRLFVEWMSLTERPLMVIELARRP